MEGARALLNSMIAFLSSRSARAYCAITLLSLKVAFLSLTSVPLSSSRPRLAQPDDSSGPGGPLEKPTDSGAGAAGGNHGLERLVHDNRRVRRGVAADLHDVDHVPSVRLGRETD